MFAQALFTLDFGFCLLSAARGDRARRAAKFLRRHEARRPREQWYREAAEKSHCGWQGLQRVWVEDIGGPCRKQQKIYCSQRMFGDVQFMNVVKLFLGRKTPTPTGQIVSCFRRYSSQHMVQCFRRCPAWEHPTRSLGHRLTSPPGK